MTVRHITVTGNNIIVTRLLIDKVALECMHFINWFTHYLWQDIFMQLCCYCRLLLEISWLVGRTDEASIHFSSQLLLRKYRRSLLSAMLWRHSHCFASAWWMWFHLCAALSMMVSTWWDITELHWSQNMVVSCQVYYHMYKHSELRVQWKSDAAVSQARRQHTNINDASILHDSDNNKPTPILMSWTGMFDLKWTQPFYILWGVTLILGTPQAKLPYC